MRNLVGALVAVAVAVPAVPAAAYDGAPRHARAQHQGEQTWRGQEKRLHCRKPNGTTGLLVGGAAGVLGGRAIDRRGNRTTGSVLGGAIGALLGRHLERNVVRSCR